MAVTSACRTGDRPLITSANSVTFSLGSKATVLFSGSHDSHDVICRTSVSGLRCLDWMLIMMSAWDSFVSML